MLRVLDDAAYGVGLRRGAIDRRTADPLLPDLTSWPRPSRYVTTGAAIRSRDAHLARRWRRLARPGRARYRRGGHGDVIAVVKGNGYGFGRPRLAAEAAALGLRRVAVGTVHELAGLPAFAEPPIVLTPVLGADVALADVARHPDRRFRRGRAAPAAGRRASRSS